MLWQQLSRMAYGLFELSKTLNGPPDCWSTGSTTAGFTEHGWISPAEFEHNYHSRIDIGPVDGDPPGVPKSQAQGDLTLAD